jgi:hypothetical protein
LFSAQLHVKIVLPLGRNALVVGGGLRISLRRLSASYRVHVPPQTGIKFAPATFIGEVRGADTFYFLGDRFIYVFGWGEANVGGRSVAISGSRVIKVNGKVELRGHLLVYLAERIAR